ncbi:MAG: hypothetical protein WCL08_10735, partial [Verrucomicrobiota bacterium]
NQIGIAGHVRIVLQGLFYEVWSVRERQGTKRLVAEANQVSTASTSSVRNILSNYEFLNHLTRPSGRSRVQGTS